MTNGDYIVKSMMLDIETLSTQPDACVTSFGVVAFNEEGIVDRLKCAIAATQWTGHIEPATVAWWLQQSDEARKAVVSAWRGAGEAAQLLDGFVLKHGCDELWANDPDFDVVIMRQWWKRLRVDAFPVSYKASRSCRTIYAEARRRGISLESAYEGHVAHDPLSDAECQARAVILARRSF